MSVSNVLLINKIRSLIMDFKFKWGKCPSYIIIDK